MKKDKYIWFTALLSSTITLPILPFLTSCGSNNNRNNVKEITIDKQKDNSLLNIINENINKTNLIDENQINDIEIQLLKNINNLFEEGDIFDDVVITLLKPNLGSQSNHSNANIEIIINPNYQIKIAENESNFIVKNNKLVLKNNIETGINNFINTQFNIEKQNGLTNIGSSSIKIKDSHPRSPQTQVYSTALIRDYGENYGFIYPGYNRNYEAKNGQNGFFTNKNNPSDRIDGTTLVYNERVEDGSNKKYNDAGWISSQISKGTFKKHPAADNFFENDISNINSVDVEYDISTVVTGSFALGLYAPPGEIITIQFDDETFNKIINSNWSGDIVINENFWDNRAAPDSGRISNRYPFLESVWWLNKDYKTLKFGSPFGGGISIRIKSRLFNNSSNLPIDNSVSNLKFKISGAIPCMFYQDGITTEQQWEEQKRLVQENKLAPIIQGNGPFHSFTIPFIGLNRVGNSKVSDLKYPKENFKKWNDFLYLSNYYAGRDLDNNLQRLNMEFCDDIWGGAGAWGGGMSFYCPIQWGNIAFFAGKPIETFNPSNSWGVFHEINHNFEQNSALFKKRGHGETNQVTAFNLSVISDGGRARSELNYSGDPNRDNNSLGWSRLNNPYVTIYDILRNGSTDEYPIYSLLLFMFGSKNYSDYLRWDVRNHPNTPDNWTGFEEIETLSNHFKLNLWPAFFDYGKYWNDRWPTSNEQITANQRKVINELATKYPAVDFVANHYACGNYIYDSELKCFKYAGDITTPWEIEAGKPIILNLDKFIISTNKNFNWNNIEFDTATQNGGKLELIGNKKLKYTPPKDPSIIDEFDISIIPGTWADKPVNYVPKYKFKIKMRQVVNEPILTLYEDLSGNNINQNFEDIFSGKIKVKYSQPMAIYNTNKFTNSSAKQAIKIDFNFVAPKDSTYVFKAKWDDAVRIRFDGKNVFQNNSWTNNFNQFQTKELKKGDVLHIEAFVINTGGQGGFDLQVFDSEGNSIDWMENALIPNYVNVVDKNLNASEVLCCDKYKYKTRTIDKNVFNSDITSNINLSDYQIPYYDPNKYVLNSKYSNVQNLNNFGTNYFELWNEDHAKGQAASSFQVKFNSPSLVKTLFFGHRTNNHGNSRATHIKVTGYADDSLKNGVVLYDGQYGKEFNDRSLSYSVLNLNQPMVVKNLHIEAYNTKNNGLIWQWFRCSDEYYKKIQSNLSVNDAAFSYSNNWTFKVNDEENTSSFNNIYTVSRNKGDTVKINLKNKCGFALVGQMNQVPTKINIYINEQKINIEPILLQSNQRIDNHCLYKYLMNNPQDMTIEIEHLDNNPLFLNYVMVF